MKKMWPRSLQISSVRVNEQQNCANTCEKRRDDERS